MRWLKESANGDLSVHPSKLTIVRQYALLDTLVEQSKAISGTGEHLILPGFGPNFGVRRRDEWEGSDLEALIATGVVARCNFR